VGLKKPDWHDPHARALAFTLAPVADGESLLHVAMNMGDEPVERRLPEITRGSWHIAIDTAAEPPRDAMAPPDQRALRRKRIEVSARSVMVLEGY
jgi:glycogen operon protein